MLDKLAGGGPSPSCLRTETRTGIVRLGRDYITDDGTSGRILRVHPDGKVETISLYAPSAVGLGLDPVRRLLSVAVSDRRPVRKTPLI
jgi:hypothetical protein